MSQEQYDRGANHPIATRNREISKLTAELAESRRGNIELGIMTVEILTLLRRCEACILTAIHGANTPAAHKLLSDIKKALEPQNGDK